MDVDWSGLPPLLLLLGLLHLGATTAVQLGRATFYGGVDSEYTLNDGSCACHKRGGFLNPCSSQFCFDYIGEKQPGRGAGLVAAINTPGIRNTDQCGACYQVSCVDGPTRGLPTSSEGRTNTGCSSNGTITVMITDSCPCNHENASNQKWCCGDTQHFDLSYSAFGALADHNAGVIDLQYERVPLVMCRTPDQAVNTGTCNKYWGVLVSADVWKLFVGVGICMAIAGISGFVFVKSVYGFRTPRPFAANAA